MESNLKREVQPNRILAYSRNRNRNRKPNRNQNVNRTEIEFESNGKRIDNSNRIESNPLEAEPNRMKKVDCIKKSRTEATFNRLRFGSKANRKMEPRQMDSNRNRIESNSKNESTIESSN